jgi:hypothetical protein
MRRKLLPCPFCGGEARDNYDSGDWGAQAWVSCRPCGARGPWTELSHERALKTTSGAIIDRAVALWNGRKP